MLFRSAALGLRRAGAAGRPAGRAALGLRRAGAAGRPAGRAALGLRRAGAVGSPARPFALGVLPVSSVVDVSSGLELASLDRAARRTRSLTFAFSFQMCRAGCLRYVCDECVLLPFVSSSQHEGVFLT